MGVATDLPTPELFTAAENGSVEEVKSLIAADATNANAVDPSQDGKTALAAAAGAGHTEIVEALLKGGAVDAPVRGWTAACHAAFGGHRDSLAALAAGLGTAAIASPPVSGTSMTPLLLACTRGHLACVSLIVEASPEALADARDVAGRTPLMLAASSGNAELINYLGQQGVKLNDTSKDGKTALMWAVVSHQPLAVEALAQLGADLTLRTNPNPHAAVIPGKDMTKGETAEELASSKNARDPTMRFIAIYLRELRELREQTPGAPAPAMTKLPWKAHAEQFVAAEAARKAAEAAEAAAAPAEASAIADAGESDIFGDADVAPSAEREAAVPASDVAAESSSPKVVDITDAAQAGAAVQSADLDDLD